MRLKKNLFAIFFFHTLVCCAQNYPLHFENYTTANGLSNNNVTCFYQDNKGFLWIGTEFGLNRFDGNFFKIFYNNPIDSNSISGNYIIDILQDESGIFWIATRDGGLTRYDPTQQIDKQFKRFIHDPLNKNSIASNRLTCLYNYNSDYLLIGAEGTASANMLINKHNFKTKLWQLDGIFLEDQNPGEKILQHGHPIWIHHVEKYNEHSFLISFLTPGYVLLARNDSLLPKVIGYNNVAVSVPDFCKDGKTIWCAGWSKGLYKQQPIEDTIYNKNIINPFSTINDYITCVKIFDSLHIVAGSVSSGIYIINKKDGSLLHFTHNTTDANSISSNKINCIYKDVQGIWWIGTANGISKYDAATWAAIQTQSIITNSNHQFTSFSMDVDNAQTLRICTSDGIYKKTKKDTQFHLITFNYNKKKVEPTLIYKYNTSQYLLGTENSFFKYQPLTESIEPFPQALSINPGNYLYSFSTFQIRSVLFDTTNYHPAFLFAALGWGLGVYNIQQKNLKLFVYDDTIAQSIKNNLSHKVVSDKNHQIWVATADGLYKWNRNNSRQNNFPAYLPVPNNAKTLSNGDITDIFVDENNHLWLTTNGGGLNEFDGKNFTHYYAPQTSSNVMYGIYPDKHNEFWIPSAAGFEIFNRQQKIFYHYNLPDNKYLLRPPTKMIITSDGSFLYSAENTFITIHPDSVHFDNSFSKIFLTDYQLNNVSMGIAQPNTALRFPHNQNFFTFYFSSPKFKNSSSVNYDYQLKGLDEKWKYTTEGKAQYTSLPPGDYSLLVRTSNERNEWSEPVTLIRFSIQPPFWLRWWFLLLCALLAIAIIYFFFRYRFMQAMKLQAMRNSIANDLHDDVGSSLSTISVYSEIAKIKAEESAGMKDVLNKISATSQAMQENMYDIVWSIQPRHDKFNQLVLRMKQHANEVVQPKNIFIEFTVDEKLSALKLSSQQRKEVYLVFKEAIHNIIKHSGCQNIAISFLKEEGKLNMTIRDDGKGFIITENTSGNGLFSMQQRAKNLKGKLQINSALNKETIIQLIFPLS